MALDMYAKKHDVHYLWLSLTSLKDKGLLGSFSLRLLALFYLRNANVYRNLFLD